MTYVQRLPQPETPVAGPSGQTFALVLVAAVHLALVVLVANQLEYIRLPWDKEPIPEDITLLPERPRPPREDVSLRPDLEPTAFEFRAPDLPVPAEQSPDEAPAGADDNRIVTGAEGVGAGSGPDLPTTLPRQDPAHPITRPPYPPTSARLGETGAVILHVCLDPAGAPTGVTVKESSGYRRLDEAALRHLRRPSTRFLPGTENGVAVPMCTDFRVRFDLTP